MTTSALDKQRQTLALGRAKAAEVRRAKAEQSAPTLREMRFAMHWIATLNARESAIRAGYSPKDADQRAWRLMRRPRVKALIRQLQDRYSRDMRIETETVLREYARIGFVNVGDFIDSEGRIDLGKVSRDQMAAVSSIETETYVDGRGEDKQEVKRVKLRFHSKTDALDALGKHLGVFERDNSQKDQGLRELLSWVQKRDAHSIAGNPDGGRDDDSDQ
jgi:phage terminase small subunit